MEKHKNKIQKHTTSNKQSNTTTNTQQTTQDTTTTTICRAKYKGKKGRAQNKTNSKQRKNTETIALEGLPSGDPGQPRRFAFCGDQMTQAVSRKRLRNSKRGLRSKQK